MPGPEGRGEVDAAIRRWVREEPEPAPGELWGELLDVAGWKAKVAAIDADVRVHETAHATVERSALALALKATKLVKPPAPLYAQLDVHLSRLGRLAYLAWESARGDTPLVPPGREARDEREPTYADAPPPGDRPARLEAAVRDLLRAAAPDATIVLPTEAMRLVRIEDDPFYDGAYYEIRVFEVLFGMGYPERQR